MAQSVSRRNAHFTGGEIDNYSQRVSPARIPSAIRRIPGLRKALFVSPNILLALLKSSESDLEKNNIKETVTISDDNRRLLRQLIRDGPHKELDQSYIMRMFLGTDEGSDDANDRGMNALNESDDQDIEIF